jgi:hypothetical protein
MIRGMKWRPRNSSAIETGSPETGATHFGEPISAVERIKKDAKNFIRPGRSLDEDYILGRLTFCEYGLLLHLWMKANPYSGMVLLSYLALAEESRGQFDKNDINKLCLSLKKSRYIWFKKLPGRRGPTEVYINYYPLAEGGYINLEALFESNVEIRTIADITEQIEVSAEVIDEVVSDVEPEVSTEVEPSPQRNVEGEEAVMKLFYGNEWKAHSKGSYNDNKNKEKKENETSAPFKEKFKYDPNRPIPQSAEEQRAREIADALGEADYVYITAKLGQYDIAVLECAFRVANKENDKGGVISVAALFNSLVEKFGSAKYGSGEVGT